MGRVPELSEIKKLREELGLSQRKLAQRCNIQPSFLNMVENIKNPTKPGYDVLVKIFNELDTEAQKRLDKLTTAAKVCRKNPTTARKSEYVDDIIKIMHDKDYSQIPVIESGGCIGLVTENSLVKFLQERDHKPIIQTKVKEVMETPPPTIDINTKITNKSLDLLSETKCLLVSENGKIMGILTKIDAIRGLMKK